MDMVFDYSLLYNYILSFFAIRWVVNGIHGERFKKKAERRGIKASIPLAFAVVETVVASWYFKLHTSKMLFDLNYSDTLILLYLPRKATVQVCT